MENDTEKPRICSHCGLEKPLADFGRNRRSPLGRLPNCRTCQNVVTANWRKKNADKSRALQQAYRSKNRDKCAESDRRWREKNPSRAKEVSRLSRQKHKSRVYARAALRRAAKLRATPPWLSDEHKAQMREAYDLAVLASEALGEPFHVDHIRPLRAKNSCGLHVPWNLRVIRAIDNLTKGNRA